MSTPTLHPNGFIQYPLGETVRLHIWSNLIPPAQNPHTPIHNHTFDFESKVILGELTHDIYEWIDPSESDEDEYELWAALPDRPDLVPAGMFRNFRIRESYVMAPYSHYRFPAGMFHDSHSDRLTATIMHKTHTGVASFPYVAVPVGTQPDNNFRRDQYPPERLMAHVYLVKEILFGSAEASDDHFLELA